MEIVERVELPQPEFWANKRVLLTGHTGFKGAWLTLWLAKMKAQVHGYALAPDTNPSLYQLTRVDQCIESQLANLTDEKALTEAVSRCDPEIVIHMAAQSLVLRGYANPSETVAVNVVGTINLLEALRRAGRSVKVIVVVTSDKVYRNDESKKKFLENSPLGGADPYSASKSAVEMIAVAYRKSFEDTGTRLITARAGNVMGGGDFAENRLVPDWWRAKNRNQPVVLRLPKAARPWQHVLDCLAGYLLYAQNAYTREVPPELNFGPEKQGVSVAAAISMLDQFTQQAKGYVVEESRQNKEKKSLMLDSTLARKELGWRPRLRDGEEWRWTVNWYKQLDEGANMREETLRQLDEYLSGHP